MTQLWVIDRTEVVAGVRFRHDISGEVKEEEGKIVNQIKLFGFSLYREEHHDKHYKACQFFPC